MAEFSYQRGELFCEAVPLRVIAEQLGTPVYVYSRAAISKRYREFASALSQFPSLICYAVKANCNLAILAELADRGSGFDIVSGGELFRVLEAGGDPSRVVFSGVGKTSEEIEQALRAGILMFNVESSGELEAIARVAAGAGLRARISLRVNPDVDPDTHPYIATGLRTSKFGIAFEDALSEYQRASRFPSLEIVGLSCHIGSQLTVLRPFLDALQRVLDLAKKLAGVGINIRYLDMGGGLGIRYRDEDPPEPGAYARALATPLAQTGLSLVIEPGRAIVGNAGALVTRVLYRKATPEKEFLVVDGGMNDLIRPALYDAYQEILPVGTPGKEKATTDVVGPVCESGDFFAKSRELPRVEPGELLAVMGTGAYGFVMASNYNARPRPAEVLVTGSEFHLVRQRESYQDLTRGEATLRKTGKNREQA